MRRLSEWKQDIAPVVALAIALLAFALRLYRLDLQSFAFDEGWTSYAIHHSWGAMWGVLAPDNHPPLYYLVVKGFAEVAGYGDFPVRFVSVMCGTALVVALYVLGGRLYGPAAGLSAAALAALSPLFVYYAQEARMYSLLMLLSTLSSYSMIRLSREPESRLWWATYALSAAGALYTHYFAVLLLLTHNVVALVWLAARRRTGLLGRWLLGQIAVALLFLPWMPTAIEQVRIGQGTWWRVPLPASVVLGDMWRFFTLGPRRPPGVPVLGPTLGGVALALCAAAVLGWRRRWGAWGFAVLNLALPAGLIVWAGSTWPAYTDRYALIVVPGMALAAGVGIAGCWYALRNGKAWWGRGAAVTLLAAAIAGPLPQLRAYYDDPTYWREDFRRAAQYVMDTTGPGDAVVLIGCYQPIMQYYRGDAAVVWFPQTGDSVQSEEEAVQALNEVITPGSQVRVVMHSWPTVDPQGLVEGALRARCRFQGEHWQRETGQRPIRVLNLETCARFEIEPRMPAGVVFGDQVALAAYRLVDLVPGHRARVLLWWRTLRRPDRNYSAFVHLVGADGEMITQSDHLPLNDFYPMQAWPIAVDQQDSYSLDVPAKAHLEGAWLAIGLYDRPSSVRLQARVGGEPVGDSYQIQVE